MYSHGAETMVAQGMLGLLFIDTGHLVEMADDGKSYAAVLSTDLWQAIKKMAPHTVGIWAVRGGGSLLQVQGLVGGI